MNNLKFNWLGQGMHFGVQTKFFSLNAHGIDLIFSIHKNPSFLEGEPMFIINREPKKNIGTINKERVVNELINEVYLVITDTDFRKRTKHSYYLLKFVTESSVMSIGGYSDSPYQMTPDNSYLVCTVDFINLIAKMTKVESMDPLLETGFKPLICLFDKNELTKELLRD